jgi:hypothetical protein
MEDKVTQINQKLRELKEDYSVDFGNINGVTLGNKTYLAFSKLMSFTTGYDSFHEAKIPFENTHIVDVTIRGRGPRYGNHRVARSGLYIGLTYPSNRGLHLMSAEDGAIQFYHHGHEADLHDTLDRWSKEESKSLYFLDNESYEDDDGEVRPGQDFAKTSETYKDFATNKPHEINVEYPYNTKYKYNLLTEQLHAIRNK